MRPKPWLALKMPMAFQRDVDTEIFQAKVLGSRTAGP